MSMWDWVGNDQPTTEPREKGVEAIIGGKATLVLRDSENPEAWVASDDPVELEQ